MAANAHRGSYLGDLLSSVFERRVSPPGAANDRPIDDLCDALLATRGETATMDLARAVLAAYDTLDEGGQRAFFTVLAERYDIDAGAVGRAAAIYGETGAAEDLARLTEAAEPKRQTLFRRLNQVQGATARLVDMRADLLRHLREDPALARIDLDMRHLFASWFNRGFLVLRRINWQSPAAILEKIIAYEAVHAIDDWDDLRRRVDPEDRRCFAYFHPAMPDDPLIFVEVALTRGTPGAIADVLAEDRAALPPDAVNTAVFYSISNCQRGLAGISFGNALIKQVVADLAAEMGQLQTFVTLSPIPGLVTWLGETRHDSPEQLAELAAAYLATAKRDDGSPRDPVARFHLSNGAAIAAIHPEGDLSDHGRAQSHGAMVNYLYDPAQVAARAERFDTEREVALTRGVEQLLRAHHRRG